MHDLRRQGRIVESSIDVNGWIATLAFSKSLVYPRGGHRKQWKACA
jgi:hypothetical protein